MAWNLGRQMRLGGDELSSLSPLLPQSRPLAINRAQLDALNRLGPAEFHRWAIRGWFEGGE